MHLSIQQAIEIHRLAQVSLYQAENNLAEAIKAVEKAKAVVEQTAVLENEAMLQWAIQKTASAPTVEEENAAADRAASRSSHIS